MTSLVPALNEPTATKFLIEACGGLTGSQTLSSFPCVYDSRIESKRFYVWIGDTDFALFTKSAFMNLSDFAEAMGATRLIFAIYHQHRQKAQFRSMFKVVDAVRIRTEALGELLGAADLEATKTVLASVLFYELAL